MHSSLSEYTSLLKNQERMRSSVTMQAHTWTPPVGLQPHTPQQITCSMMPSPTMQVQDYIAQQIMSNQQNHQQSHGLRNSQTSSQPAASSSSLQSRQMPQAWLNDLQNQMLHRNSASLRAALPNEQFVPLASVQHGTPVQTQHPQTLNRNTVSQQNYNMHNVSSPTAVSWFTSGNSNAGSATEQNNLTNQSVLSQYQSLSGHNNRLQIAHQPAAQPQQPDLSVQTNHAQQTIQNNQGWIRGGKGNGALYSSVHHSPATSQTFITSSQPSNYSHQAGQSHSSGNRNQVQHSSHAQHQPSLYRTENNSGSCINLNHNGNNHQSLMSNLPPPPAYTVQHFVIQSQPNQRINQSSALSLPQNNVQPQTPLQHCKTIPVSGHHSKTCHPTVPAIQRNTQPQVLQNNSMTGLSRSSQVPISSSTPTSEAPRPTQSYTESILNYSGFTSQGQKPSHIGTKVNYSQPPDSAINCSAPATVRGKELHVVSECQTPGKRASTLKENEHGVGNQLKAPDVQSFGGTQSRRSQTYSDTEGTARHQSNNKQRAIQYSKDIAETLELLMAMQKMLRQTQKAVAVVPPISQLSPSPEKNNLVITSSDDSPPFKINAVWTLVKESEDVDQQSNAPSPPKETTEESVQFSPEPHPEKQESDKHEDGSTVDGLIPDTRSAESPQAKIDTATSQSPVCSTDLPSESPEDHNKVKADKPNDTVFDLSMVKVYNFTLENFKYYLKIIESSEKDKVKEPVADAKSVLDLYWDRNTENFAKQMDVLRAELSDLCSGVSMKQIQTANFQCLRPKYLKLLEHSYHIVNNDTYLPTEDFRSSWLNVDGQPDIENILAEPILDYDLTEYILKGGFDTLKIYSQSDSSRKLVPAATDCQSDKMINKELVNSQVYECKSTDEVSNTQEASKKQGDENVKKHKQRDVKLNPEESIASNEIADTLTESESQTEYEQVCRDGSEDEILEQRDLSDDLDSSSDSQLISLSLLSPDDAKTIFKEPFGCDLQKESSSLYQDETELSDKKSNDFCSSASQIKFTCPHVTDTDWDGEHFCPRCWEETPLLALDLEEALFSPKWNSPNMMTPPRQGHDEPDTDCTVLSESSSIADPPTPNSDVLEVTISEPDPNPRDAVESCTSLSGNSPVKEPHTPMCTQSVSCTMPVEEHDCETNISVEPELPNTLSHAQNIENLVIPEQTKPPRDEISPIKSPPPKRLKLTKSTEMPAGDVNFTADTVTEKATSTKPHPSELGVAPAEDGQKCKDERKERGEERKSLLKRKAQTTAQCSQSGKPNPNVNVCSESSSNSSNPSTYGVMRITEPDLHLGGSVPRCRSLSGKSPDKETRGQVCSESVKATLPIEKQVYEAGSLSGPELPKAQSLTQNSEKRKPVIQPQTTTPRGKGSPPCKKVKVARTASTPADDDLFTPDIVFRKASLPKSHPRHIIEGGQHCKDELKQSGKDRKSSIVLKIQRGLHSGQTKAEAHGNCKTPSAKSEVPVVAPWPKRPAVGANSDTNTEKVFGKTRGPGPKKRTKKMRLKLYGSNNGNAQSHCCYRTKSYTAPDYVTLSNRPETGDSYTDEPSAKQKVYSQWRSTFVETKKNASSHKKHQKTEKVRLKSKTQELKRRLEDERREKEKQMVRSGA